MKFDFAFEWDDWMAFHRYHFLHSKRSRNLVRYGQLIFPLAGFAFFLAGLFNHRLNIAFIGTWAMLSAPWIILYPRYHWWSVRRSVAKMINEGDSSGILTRHHYIVTDEGIEFEIPGIKKSTVNWSGIKNLNEWNGYFFLFDTPVSAYIIPIHKIPETAPELRTFLRAKPTSV